MTLTPDELQDAAKQHLWMHFTRMSSYNNGDIPVIVRGSGPYVYDDKGKRYLDGLAGLFVSMVGHGRTELAEAASKQASELAYFPLWSYAHPAAVELAARLAQLAPGDLNRVFFTTSGSEAVESAWKLAKSYFKRTGEPARYKVLSREYAYHGTSMGALAVTGLSAIKHDFEPLPPGGVRVPNTNFYRAPEFVADDETEVRRLGRRRDRAGHPARGRRVGRGRVPRAGAELRRLLHPAARLLPAGAADLRQVRRAAGLGRGDLRVRAARLLLRVRAVRLPARHHHLRQGRHLRLLAARRHDRPRRADGAVPARRRDVPARHHVRRAPGVVRRRPGQPGRLRAGRPARQRAGERGGLPRRRWRSCSTCRSSATSAAPATSTASSWSRTRAPRRRSTTTSPSGCCAGSCRTRCSTPAWSAGPTTAATP